MDSERIGRRIVEKSWSLVHSITWIQPLNHGSCKPRAAGRQQQGVVCSEFTQVLYFSVSIHWPALLGVESAYIDPINLL